MVHRPPSPNHSRSCSSTPRRAPPAAPRRCAAASAARAPAAAPTARGRRVHGCLDGWALDGLTDGQRPYGRLSQSDRLGPVAPSSRPRTPCMLPPHTQAQLALQTPQACKFRDEYARFQDSGAAVFGISSDVRGRRACVRACVRACLLWGRVHSLCVGRSVAGACLAPKTTGGIQPP